jgi:hypothetical protein
MSPSTFRRKILVLVLGAALVATAAAAADLESPALPRPLQLLSQGTQGLLERLASLLGSFWAKEGGSIDPYGAPGNGQAPAMSQDGRNEKTGPGLDPYGVPGNGQENGCSLDPYGLCVNGQSGAGESGGSIDPYGL